MQSPNIYWDLNLGHKELGILPSCVRSLWVEQNTGNSFPSHDLSCSCESIEDHETLSKSSVAAAVSRPLFPMRRAVRIRCIAALRGAEIDYF